MSQQDAPKRKPGRPIGTGPVARLRRALMNDGGLTDDDAFDELVAKTQELAMAGHPAALRILWDRAVPGLRTRAARIRIDLPDGSLTDQAKALLLAATSGELSSDQAAELITAIGRIVSVEQGDDLRRRLDAIEHGDLA